MLVRTSHVVYRIIEVVGGTDRVDPSLAVPEADSILKCHTEASNDVSIWHENEMK